MTAAGTERRATPRAALVDEAGALLRAGYRPALVACHEDADALRVVYLFVAPAPDRRVELAVAVPRDDARVPTLAGLSFPVGRFEREMHDLYGLHPEGHPLPRRMVRHAHWPVGWYPMLRDADPSPEFGPDLGSPAFGEVEGTGVYEIPVGPVHAGLIEPGHFRFSVVGETILRMKARLWFLHRGMERLFEGRRPSDGIALAERISGDTAVGHALAYVMAVEDAAGITVDEPDRLLRALLLEMERIHNHVADLGALANDVGFGVVNAHAQRLRETLLRMCATTTGHRLLRGAIVVGGTRVDTLPDRDALRRVAADVDELSAVTVGHAVVRDRFTGTAVLSRAQAVEIGVLGYVARASGLDVDARRDHPFVDLGTALQPVVETGGDVMARYRVRVREIAGSVSLALTILARLDGRRGSGRTVDPDAAGSGVGLVEAWRGTTAHRVELGAGGVVTRVKVVDPSFFNWPALPIALADTIVPDFPLANKSFNQSYAGNDL